MTPPNPPTCRHCGLTRDRHGPYDDECPFNGQEVPYLTWEEGPTYAKLSERLRLQSAELAELRGRVAWVPVGERLPEPYVPVIAAQHDRRIDHESVDVSYIIESLRDGYVWHCRNRFTVTHWMPLPPLPLPTPPTETK